MLFKRLQFKSSTWLFLGVSLAVFLFLAGEIFGLAPEEKQPPGYQTRTLRLLIIQNPAVLVSGNSTTTSFSVFIGEQSPVIKDAYIEVSGVTQASGNQNISVDFRSAAGSICVQDFDSSRQKIFNIDSTGRSNHFELLYTGNGTTTDASLFYCLNQIITSPGTYPFEFKIGTSGADVSALQARLILTYQFTPPVEASGNYPPSGTVISPIFDTGVANGASFNWILAKGPQVAGTKVRLQFASSNNSAGPFEYLGPDCSSGTYYYNSALPLAEESKEIGCFSSHNNKRYFRYKMILMSNPPNYDATPQVDDVVVNWSP